jgi:RES domain-containing protein
VRVYRLTQQSDPIEAFGGMRSAQSPGRWNVASRAVVYTAASLSLAVLEVVVQSSAPVSADRVFYCVDVDDGLLERLDIRHLGSDWRTLAGRDGCRQLGEAWRARGAGVGLIVPSAVVPEAYDDGEVNIVLNPHHAAFGRVKVNALVRLDIDRRLTG